MKQQFDLSVEWSEGKGREGHERTNERTNEGFVERSGGKSTT